MKLYSYWRSTTSYRVRIALNLKGVAHEIVSVDLLGGAHEGPDYAALNPSKAVPALVTSDGSTLTQSIAILDYLDQVAPDPALLPSDDAVRRGRILAAAMVIATDVHPVNNLRVVNRVRDLSNEATARLWMRRWMQEGFTAFAALIDDQGPFCFGPAPSLADVCLVAQAYNAHRWGVTLAPFPRLSSIENHCLALPAFDAARPEMQKDAA